MQPSKPDIKKTTPPSEWFKNVAKSMGYSSSELIKSITPNIHSMVENNVSYGKEVFSEFKQASDDAPSLTSLFKADDYVKLAKTALNNTIEDISTGKLYNKERQEAFDDEDFGEFMAGLESGEYSTSDDDSSEGSTVNKTTNVTINKNVDRSIISGATQATIEANKATTTAIIQSNQRMVATKASMDAKANIANLKGLETINENIAQLVNFQNDSMAKYIGASIKYYDESLEVMRSSMQSLINMGGGTKDAKESGKTNAFEDVFYGGFNLEGYVGNVKGNLNRMKDDDMFISFINQIFSDQDHLSYLSKSPLAFISKQVTTKLIPLTIQKTMENLDKSMTEFLPAMFNKLGNLSESSNPLLASLGRLLGIDSRAKSSVDMAAYERGAISYDGESKRALTDVIPTYLRKMYSLMSGTKEMAFDWEKGTWSNVDDMRKNYNNQRLSQATNAYTDQNNELTGYLNNIKFENAKDKASMEQGIKTFLYNVARSKEELVFDNSAASQSKISELSGLSSSPELGRLLGAMVNNLDRSDKVNLVGAGRYKALANINKFFEEMSNNPTMNNATTLLAGLEEDNLFKKNADGKIVKAQAQGIGGKIDAWGKNDLFYLRSILDTLTRGIRVYSTSTKKVDTGFLDDRISKFDDMKQTKVDEVSATKSSKAMSSEEKEKFKASGGIDLTGQIDNGDFNEKILSIKQANQAESKRNNKDIFGDTIGGSLNKQQENFYAIREKLDTMMTKPADVLNKAFGKIDETLYNIVFGIRNDGRGSFMDHTLEKMEDMFNRVADFAVTKVFSPLADMIGGMFSKASGAIKENPLVNAVKDGVKYWFVGEKGANGREGGVLSGMMNSALDATKSINTAITGVGYTDSNGVKHEGNENSLFHTTGAFFKDILGATKDHFIGDRSAKNPEGRRGMITIMTDTIGDGMSEWSTMLFGTKRDKEKTGTQILADNTKALVAQAPRGILGAAAGAGLGAVLLSGTGLAGGLLTSFFVPGAPLALAMAGGALGIATGFDSFKEWAFGREDYDGTRMGGALMSQNMQSFFKNNKSTLIGGAIGGMALNFAGEALLSSIVPGAGMILNFLSPFGPVGAAMQGMATALLFKSESVLSFLFGDKMPDGKRIGGLLQRIFKKPNADMSKKAVGKKGALIATGILGGAALGLGAETLFGTMGILGTLIAGPAGPIMGAVAGLAASIMLGSDKFSSFLFGSKGEDGVEKVGIFEKFNNFFSVNIIQPFTNRMSKWGKDTLNWFMNKHIPALQFAFEPVVKAIKETIGGVLKSIKLVGWDLPKSILTLVGKGAVSIAKTTGNLIGKTYESVFGTTIKQSLVDPVLKIAGKIGDPLNKLANGLFTTGEMVMKGLANLGDTVSKIPAALSMTLLRGIGLIGSTAKGIGEFAKGAFSLVRDGVRSKNDGQGNGTRTGLLSSIGGLAKNTLGGAAIFARHKASDLGQWEDGQAERYSKADAKYRDEKDRIDKEYKERRAIIDQTKKDYQLRGYGNKVKSISGSDLENFRMSISKISGGLSIEEILNAKGKVFHELSAKEQKLTLSRIEKMSSKGVRGNDLRRKLGILDKVEDAQEVMRRKMNENVQSMATNVESISKALNSFVNGDKSPSMILNPDSTKVITEGMSQALDDVTTGGSPKSSPENVLSRAVNRVQSVDNVNINFDASNSVLRKPTPEQYSQFLNDKESTGGALGAVISKTKNYTKQQVASIGCGPIVLSMILGEYGKNVSAEEIYKFAEENGLVKRGVGVSSDIFKVYAGKNGLTYEHVKPSLASLEKIFDKTHSVISRLNTGMGHFVMAYNYNPEQGTIMVKDPMGKIDGTINVEKFIKHSTHFYLVYKKGITSYLSSSVGKIKDTLTKGISNSGQSLGGALGSTLASIPGQTTRLGVPVVIVKTKQQEKEDEQKFETLLNAISGGGNQQGSNLSSSSGTGVDGTNPREFGGSMNSGLNHVNLLIRMISGAFGLGKAGVTRAINAGKGRWNNAKAMSREEMIDGAKGRMTNARTNARIQMARGGSALMTGAGIIAGRIGRGLRAGGRFMSSNAGRGLTRGAMGALSRAGDLASDTNLNAMAPSYRTTADAEEGFQYVNDGTSVESQKKAYNRRRDVNHFLQEQASKAAAEVEAKFKNNNIDLLTRIEINTRRTTEVLEGIGDLVKKFTDWLKPFMEGIADSIKDLSNLSDMLKNFDFLGIPNLLPDDFLFKRAVKKKMDRIIELLEDIKKCSCDDDGEIDIDIKKKKEKEYDKEDDGGDNYELDVDVKRRGERGYVIDTRGRRRRRDILTLPEPPRQLRLPGTIIDARTGERVPRGTGEIIDMPETNQNRNSSSGGNTDTTRTPRTVVELPAPVDVAPNDPSRPNSTRTVVELPTPVDVAPNDPSRPTLDIPEVEPVRDVTRGTNPERVEASRDPRQVVNNTSTRINRAEVIDAEWSPVNEDSNSNRRGRNSASSRNETTGNPDIDAHLNRQRQIIDGFDEAEDRARNGGRRNKKGFFSKAMDIMKGGSNHGIVAGSGVTGSIPTKDLMKGAGKNILKGAGKATKFIPGIGLLASAGLAGVDYKYGSNNAQDIFNVAPDQEMTGTQKKAAGVATAAVGLIPFGDLIDEELFKGKMKETIAKLIDETVNMFTKVGPWIGEQWDSLKENLSKAFTAIGETTSTAWNKLTTSISTGWENLKTSVTTKVESIIKSTKEKWENLKKSISTGWDNAKKAVTDKVESIIKSTKEKWENLKKSISTGWDNAKKAVTTKVESIIKAASDKWESIKKSVSDGWDKVKKAITDKIEEAKNAIGDFKKALGDAVTNVKDKIVEKITGGIDSVKVSFTGLATTIKDKITAKISSALDALNIKLPSWLGGGKGGNVGGVGGPPPSTTTNNVFNMADFKGSANEKEMIKLADQMSTVAKGCPCDDDIKKKGIGGPEFDQNDPRWKGVKVAGKETMGTAGCGPTVAANAVNALTGSKVLPTEALKFAQRKGFVSEGQGTSSNMFSEFGQANGVSITPTVANGDSIKSQLEQGNKVILRGINGANYTDEGHYILADGIKNGKVSIKDPMGKGRSGLYDMSKVSNGMTHAFTATNAKGISNILSSGLPPTTGKGPKIFSNPLPGAPITSRYGYRTIQGAREFHWGIDLAKANGVIQAAADGEVSKVDNHVTYGNVVFIRHNIDGQVWTTVYAHMKNGSIRVRAGEKVRRGQNLGVQGDTGRSFGAHLHFEIHKGEYKYKVNNVNPEPYIFANGNATPEGFDGPNAGLGITGGEMFPGGSTEKVTGASLLSNMTSMFDTSKLYGDDISSLPGMMQNLAMSLLFGQEIDLTSGTALDKSGSSSSGTVGNTDTSSIKGSSVAEKSFNYFTSKGLSKAAAAGILGNFQQESSMDPAKNAHLASPNVKGPIGITQWLGGRKTNFLNSATQKNTDWKDLGHQLDYIWYELNGGDPTTVAKLKKYGGLQGFMKEQDPAQAAYIYDDAFTRSGFSMIDKRKAYANKFFDIYGKGGTGGPLVSFDKGENIYDTLADLNAKYEPQSKAIGGPTELSEAALGFMKQSNEPVSRGLKAQDKRLNDMAIENLKLQSTDIELEARGKGRTEYIKETQVMGMGGAWTEEAVSEALSLLRDIAGNTSETTTAFNNFNTNNFVGTSGGSSSPQPRSAMRQQNQAAQVRNSKILQARK